MDQDAGVCNESRAEDSDPQGRITSPCAGERFPAWDRRRRGRTTARGRPWLGPEGPSLSARPFSRRRRRRPIAAAGGTGGGSGRSPPRAWGGGPAAGPPGPPPRVVVPFPPLLCAGGGGGPKNSPFVVGVWCGD